MAERSWIFWIVQYLCRKDLVRWGNIRSFGKTIRTIGGKIRTYKAKIMNFKGISERPEPLGGNIVIFGDIISTFNAKIKIYERKIWTFSRIIISFEEISVPL